MYSRDRQGKGSKGSVQFKTTKGRLQIVFSYPIEEDGEIKRKRFYISTGFDDTPLNRQRVGDTVRMIQRDIDYGEVDLSLKKYKPTASLSTVSPIPPISSKPTAKTQLDLADLWEKYMEFKRPSLSPSTLAKDYSRVARCISVYLPTKAIKDAVRIRDWLVANKTPDASKRMLTQFSACCKWAMKSKLISENPFKDMAVDVKVPKGDDEDTDINPFTLEERDSPKERLTPTHHCCLQDRSLLQILRPADRIPVHDRL